MPIPKGKAQPVVDLRRKKILLHSFPKFGKTRWASTIPDSIFLATEPGLGSVEVLRWEDENGRYVIDSWDKLLVATKEVVDAGRFSVLIIDTIDIAYELCRQWVCEKHAEEYHTDGKLSYGKGTSLINNEIRRYLTRLGALDMGVVLLGHTVVETVSTRNGDIQRAVPNLPEKVRQPILGLMDLILYGDMEWEQSGKDRIAKRIVRTKPSPAWEAGDRSGKLPASMGLSWSEMQEAFIQDQKTTETQK